MALRRRVTGALATLVVAASITGLPATAHAAPATGSGTTTGTTAGTASGTPHEVTTLPAPLAAAHRKDILVAAGTTGFLHQEQGLPGYTWTDYTTGNDTHVPHLDGASFIARPFHYPASAGGDAVFYWTFSQTAVQLNVGTPASGAWAGYTLPAGTLGVAGVNGTRALLHETDGLHLVQLNGDGTTTELPPIAGLPTGYTFSVPTLDAGSGTVAMFSGSPKAGTTGTSHSYLVQLDTGKAVQVPDTLRGGILSGGYIYSVTQYQAPTNIVSLKVSDVLAGASVQPATTNFTLPGTTQVWGVAGGHVLVTNEAAAYAAPTSLYATPVGSTAAPAQVDSGLVTNAPYMVFGPSGALTVGGSADESVQRLSGAADGSLAVASVRQLPPPVYTTATLTMDYGQVRQVLSVPQVNGSTDFPVHTTPLAARFATGAGLGLGPAGAFEPSATPGPCAPDANCVRIADGNWNGPAYITPAGLAYSDRIRAGSSFGAGATIVDADDAFLVVDQGGKQYLWEAGTADYNHSAVPATGAALWQHTLWRSSATTAGRIEAHALTSGLASTPVVRTISTGTACTPDEVQVAQHWLYWSCGSAGQAGVYDLATNVGISVPTGPVLLGDGYLVRHDAASGELRMTDVHNDTVGATTVLATFPMTGSATDDRHLSWTVDRTSGEVAYAGTDNVVHVLATGVPASPITALTSQSMDTVFVGQTYPVNIGGTMSRPAASWRVVVSRADNGRQVRVLTGGQTPAGFQTNWDGYTDAHTKPLDGRYTWQLWATPLDDPTAPAAPVTGASGSINVQLGRQTFHSYNEDGRPNLFGIAAASTDQYPVGASLMYEGTGNGAGMVDVGPRVPANLDAAYSKVATLIPFGDLNGDGQNDLLVRLSNGTLGYYSGLPNCSDAATCRPITISGGWSSYDRLVSVGDLNSDGHDDLVARDRSGVLWFYAGTGHGRFAPRVRMGAGWNAYTRIIGAGDLLAVDAAGRMWRYLGNGHGGFGTRTLLGAGWNAYNAVVGVGDLNGDGRNDLVARDRSGVLWFYAGDGHGGFAPRARVGGGWNRYTTIY